MELQEAWAEFTEAAEGSGVTSLHSCSRSGERWRKTLWPVRGLAADLLNFPLLLHAILKADITNL